MYNGVLIGIGNIALNAHLPAVATDPQLQQKLRFVAGVDFSADNRQAMAKLLPEARIYASLEELFRCEKIHFDFIDICTPPNSHLDIIERFFKANGPCHVLCEKPVVVNSAEVQQLRDLFSKLPYVFLPCHQYRYTPQWRIISETISADRIGRPHMIQFNVFRTHADIGNQNFLPNWRTNKQYAGGGILVDHGAHLFYLSAELLGEPKLITSRISNLFHSYEGVEDSAWVHVEHQHGVTELMLTWAAQHRAMYYKILGDRGEIITYDDHIEIRTKDNCETINFNSALSDKKAKVEWFSFLLREFVNKIETADYGNDGLDEALLSVQCIQACYQSASKGQTVRFPEFAQALVHQ